MNSEHFKINNIANETMKTSLKNSLENIKGVNNVFVDIARGSVEVEYNAPATINEIKSCIDKTNPNMQ